MLEKIRKITSDLEFKYSNENGTDSEDEHGPEVDENESISNLLSNFKKDEFLRRWEKIALQNLIECMKFLENDYVRKEGNSTCADFIKNFDGESFVFSTNPVLDEISFGLESSGHSANSFALTLRKCQYLLNKN